MRPNTRLSVALHVLAHLAEHPDQPATSAQLAACVGTNAVVVRRTLGLLRRAGLVGSVAGHGGGWLLRQMAEAMTLADVYRALDERLLAINVAQGRPSCRIVRAVAGALDDFAREVEPLLLARLQRVTLAGLLEAVRRPAGDGLLPPAEGEIRLEA